MFGWLVLLFTVLPAFELVVLIKVGSVIGAINTLFVIITTGVVGAYLARMQGFLVLRNIQTRMAQGEMPTSQMLDGLMILVGGIVLLTPGFITDTIGFLLLIPFTRALIKKWVQFNIEQMVKNGQVINVTTFRNQSKGGNGYIDI